jgi:hypothetical protein
LMKRCRSILVVLVTVAGVATSLFAGGPVLCIGPDRHEEVEFRHTTCPESAGHDHHDHDSDDGDSDCVDFELAHDFGDHSGRGVDVVDHSWHWVAISVAVADALLDGEFEPAVPQDEGPPGAGVLRCISSVVLLI